MEYQMILFLLLRTEELIAMDMAAHRYLAVKLVVLNGLMSHLLMGLLAKEVTEILIMVAVAAAVTMVVVALEFLLVHAVVQAVVLPLFQATRAAMQ
jgi:hypothetical protein